MQDVLWKRLARRWCYTRHKLMARVNIISILCSPRASYVTVWNHLVQHFCNFFRPSSNYYYPPPLTSETVLSSAPIWSAHPPLSHHAVPAVPPADTSACICNRCSACTSSWCFCLNLQQVHMLYQGFSACTSGRYSPAWICTRYFPPVPPAGTPPLKFAKGTFRLFLRQELPHLNLHQVLSACTCDRYSPARNCTRYFPPVPPAGTPPPEFAPDTSAW
jgi:hypothetical protein